MDDAAAVALCIHGESLWHRLGLAALGAGWEERDGIARRTAPTVIVFLGAITLRPEVTAEQLDAAVRPLPGRVVVRDSYGTIDLARLGWRRWAMQPWMLRPPGAVARVRVPGLRIAAAHTPDEVRTFERTVFGAADGNPEWAPEGSVHPAEASLHVPGLSLLIAWWHGVPVGTAFALVDERAVQIGAVSVAREARRRGIGTALTAAAIAQAPELPAVLDSTALGHGVYLALGFRDVGESVLWDRPG